MADKKDPPRTDLQAHDGQAIIARIMDLKASARWTVAVREVTRQTYKLSHSQIDQYAKIADIALNPPDGGGAAQVRHDSMRKLDEVARRCMDGVRDPNNPQAWLIPPDMRNAVFALTQLNQIAGTIGPGQTTVMIAQERVGLYELARWANEIQWLRDAMLQIAKGQRPRLPPELLADGAEVIDENPQLDALRKAAEVGDEDASMQLRLYFATDEMNVAQAVPVLRKLLEWAEARTE